jgi:DNA replication and repair protein RecF
MTIKNIKLSNFRKFNEIEIPINKDIVILYGDNAQGKSTILEAIVLITNGSSPWASSDEYISFEQEDDKRYTRIEISIDEKTFSFFKNNGKRVFQIDSQKTTPKKFFEKTASTIFNPEQIEILMISPSKRRDFLDETICLINYDYLDTLRTFRKTLRQRNAYLKKLSKDFYERGTIARNDTQLNFWTDKFINLSKEIQGKRIELCNEITSKDIKIEYIKSNGQTPLEEKIETSKKRDIATGYTNIGPHRDDWNLINGKDIKKFGSRGEKRLSIGQLLFSKQELVAKKLGFYPILLLDDISSELDKKNTKKVFDKEFLSKQQTFITTLDYKKLPKEIVEKAQLINLNSLK